MSLEDSFGAWPPPIVTRGGFGFTPMREKRPMIVTGISRTLGAAALIAAGALAIWACGVSRASQPRQEGPDITVETAPPVVVKTIPEAGSADVDPNLKELRIVFSKPMKDGFWSMLVIKKESFPEINGKIHYLQDGKTCVVPVKLQPNRNYGTWLNSQQNKNFKDQDGRPAVPYLLTFKTK